MHVRRLLVCTSTALLLAPLAAAPALAAVPGNDLPSGAIAVDSIPWSSTQDTTEATTDAVDAALNADCGAPATNGSVWFAVADPTGAGIMVDVSGSDYSAGVLIAKGDPDAGGTLAACGPGASAVLGDGAATTWYVMAFSDTPGVTGGTLQISVAKAPPAPSVGVTVNSRGYAYKDGSLRLSGTYTCADADWGAWLEGSVTQTVGRVKISGDFVYEPLVCDGATHTWTAYAYSYNGLFAGGKAANVTAGIACGLVDCSVALTEQKIQVSRAGK